MKMTRRTNTSKEKKNGTATCSHNENVFSSKMNMATTGPEQKTATQGPALNEKLRYCRLNIDKMDGSVENCTVNKWRLELKMAERS